MKKEMKEMEEEIYKADPESIIYEFLSRHTNTQIGRAHV